MNRSIINLELNGRVFSGWKSLGIAFDMEALSTAFNFNLYDKGSVVSDEFKTGFASRVLIKPNVESPFEDLLADGYITKIDRSISGESTSMSIEGSDKLIDLVDCSALHTSQTWTNKRFTLIVRDILAPFGLDVDITQLTADPKIEKFTLQSGESAFIAIERLCRSQAVLPLATVDGVLLLGYSANEFDRTLVNLEVGVNVKSLTESSSWQSRFSRYIGRSQTTGRGKRWTAKMLQCAAEAVDSGVTRYRPLLFIAENKADNALLGKRVNWEAQVRSGRALEHVVTVDGFYQKADDGEPLTLWQKNKRVNLKCEYWNLDIERLITKVDFSLNEGGGELTTMTLKHPDIFKPDPSATVDLTP